jgi:predicted nucleic acid-binding protein
MEPEYLIDSNAVIGFLARQIPAPGMAVLSAIIDQKPRISVITQIEVLRFNDISENEQILADFVASSIIYPLTEAIVWRTITICKQGKIKLPDAIIAATALTEDCILVTRNERDFKNIAGLRTFNPWDSFATRS